MSYIGNTPEQQAFSPAIDYFSGNGSTVAFTLSRPVASVAQVQVVVNNVDQNPSTAFTVSGNTLTFTGAPSSGTNNIYVYYTSPITQVIQPGQGTVGTTQLALNSVTGTGVIALASLPTFTTTVGVGGATASASGSGITFPATQSASSDANTLDDYEEGSWTPAFNLLGTLTYSQQTGKYTKIGRMVTVSCNMALSSTDSTQDASVALVTGLPFTAANTTQGSTCLLTESLKGTGSASAPNTFFVLADAASTNLRLYANNYNGNLALKSYFSSATRATYTGGSVYIYFTHTYEAA